MSIGELVVGMFPVGSVSAEEDTSLVINLSAPSCPTLGSTLTLETIPGLLIELTAPSCPANGSTIQVVTTGEAPTGVPVILSSSGNKAGSLTTIVTNTDVDLTLANVVTATRGGIPMTSVVVLNATTIAAIEPSSGLEVGINHDLVIGYV